MSVQEVTLRRIDEEQAKEKAVLFIHGFIGDKIETWGNFPSLLVDAFPERAVYTLGYATSLLPDFIGFWSADPDLPLLSEVLTTEFEINPLLSHKEVAVVAHSMGGLIAQKALIDDEDTLGRVSHLFLFGTPSAGVARGGFLKGLWKGSLKNMEHDGAFITSLRAAWTAKFGNTPPFDFRTVAGSRDRFVETWSSLEPFDKKFHAGVTGDHVQIVKPTDRYAQSFRVVETFLRGLPAAPMPSGIPGGRAPRLSPAKLTQEKVVADALAADEAGNRDLAIDLLKRALSVTPDWTDAMGALGGRLKRDWIGAGMSEEAMPMAQEAMGLYQKALAISAEKAQPKQVYYPAINLAFLELVALDQSASAQSHAELALAHAQAAHDQGDTEFWNAATQAEANLILGHHDVALRLYKVAVDSGAEPWQVASAGQQAGILALKLENLELAVALEPVFKQG